MVVVGGLEQFSVSPRPLVLGLRQNGLGLRVWGQGLTIKALILEYKIFTSIAL